jgi:polar amino acid transport system permease protein
VHGAYGSELVRGAVRSVPKHQREAAVALSMSPLQRMRRVIFPQALAAMMPLFNNEFILLLKATSVCSLITLAELTFSAHSIVVRTHTPGAIFTAVLLTYFLLASAISFMMRAAERRLAYWRNPGAQTA